MEAEYRRRMDDVHNAVKKRLVSFARRFSLLLDEINENNNENMISGFASGSQASASSVRDRSYGQLDRRLGQREHHARTGQFTFIHLTAAKGELLWLFSSFLQEKAIMAKCFTDLNSLSQQYSAKA